MGHADQTTRRHGGFPYPRRVTVVDTDLVVLEVVTRWRIDAAIFLAAGAGFFTAGIADEAAAQGIVSFVVGFVLATLLDRISSPLPSSAQLAGSPAPPEGARRASARRYTVESMCSFLALWAVFVVVLWAWGNAHAYGWLGGWLAAYGVARLYGIARARQIERLDRVVLLSGVGSWRNRVAGYYATRTTL